MSAQEDEQNQRRAFNLIRITLLLGVVIFGALAWLLGRVLFPGGMAPELIQGIESYVEYGFILTVIAIGGGVVALRSPWQAANDFEAERQINLVGWALAEFPALLGGGYLMLVGDPVFFGVGLVLMILTAFVLLPISDSD